MNHVLFRGKEKDNDCWVYGYYVKLLKNQRNVNDFKYEHTIIPIDNCFPCINSNLNPVIIIPETLGQYTNRDDINNHKIFENDYCRILCRQDSSIYKVIYNGGQFVLENGNSIIALTDLLNHEIEVIGDLQKNPTLL